MLRPVVCPAVEGYIRENQWKSGFLLQVDVWQILILLRVYLGMEEIPFLAENDAGLDIEHWTGHTGCVIVAPHLAGTPKQILESSIQSKCNRKRTS